nr:hypothetical protein [Candidatus Sigynarchaeota archaeon]
MKIISNKRQAHGQLTLNLMCKSLNVVLGSASFAARMAFSTIHRGLIRELSLVAGFSDRRGH